MPCSDYLPGWLRRDPPAAAPLPPRREQPEVLNSERSSNAVRPATQAVAIALDNAAYNRDFNRIDAHGHIEEARAYRRHGFEGGSQVIARREGLNLDRDALRENYASERETMRSRPDTRQEIFDSKYQHRLEVLRSQSPNDDLIAVQSNAWWDTAKWSPRTPARPQRSDDFVDRYRGSLISTARQGSVESTEQALHPRTQQRF